MRDTVLFQKEITVKYEVDVMVAGGGPAGVAAAVSAAQNGAAVYLAEKNQCFGGMGTAAKVPAFMRFSDGVNFLAGGIGKRIFQALYGENTDYTEIEYAIDTEKLKTVYDDMIVSSGISFTFESTLIDVVSKSGSVQYAVVHGKEQIFAVKAKVFIDATGDGSLAVMAGAGFEKGDEDQRMMPATLCSQWAEIDWDKAVVELGKDPDNRMLKKAFSDGVFTVKDPSLPGMWHRPDGLGGGNIGHVFDVDGTDEQSITSGIIEARKRMGEYVRYYREYLPGYENARLTATADVLGIRETRRIRCVYRMTFQNYLHNAEFEDEIGRYCYPIDIHASSVEEQPDYADLYAKGYGKGKSYGISYRALLPENTENVLVCGRCIGAERSMMGSLRVMPACFITGAAAGAAAAEAVHSHSTVREIQIGKLQERIRSLEKAASAHVGGRV